MIALACKALIATSLAANAVLAFALWRPAASKPAKLSPKVLALVAQAAPSSNASPALSSDGDRALLLETAARFGRTPAMGDPRALAEKMYREGYPEEVISKVIAPMLDEWLGQKALEKAAREGSSTARRLRAIGAGGGPLQKYMNDLFPGWGERAREDQARERTIRFGNLSLEKVLAIERIEEEFAFKPNQRSSYNQANVTEQTKIEGKIDEALRGTLTPEELKNYWRFNSLLAYQLQQRVSRIDIDEAAYDRLLAVATRREHVFFQQPLGDFRGILSDSQLVQLIGNDSRYRPADNLFRAAGLSDTQRAEFYTLAEAVFDGRQGARSREMAANALNQIRTALAGSPEFAAEFEAGQMAKMLNGAAQRK